MAAGKRIAVRAVQFILIIIAVMALIVGLVFVALQTGPGRRYAARTIANRIGAALDSEARVEGVGGRLPFNTRIKRIALQDKDGVWAVLENVYFDWAPGALARGRVSINEISAQYVAVERMPQRQEKKAFQIPALPRRVPHVTVRRFDVARLALSKQIAGAPTVLAVSGSVDYVKATDGLRASMRVDGIEGPPVEGRATFALNTRPSPALEVDVRYSEPRQGPVTHWLGLGSAPVTLSISGSGPLDGWNGTVAASASGREIVQARVKLAKAGTGPVRGVEPLAVTADGEVTLPDAVLPPDLQPVLGIRNTFSVAAQVAPGEKLDVDNAAISSLLGNLKTSGNIDFKTGEVDIKFSTRIDNLASIQGLVGVPLEGALTADGTVTGKLKQPVVEMDVQASKLKLGGASAETFTGQLHFEAIEEWQEQVPRGKFNGKGTLTGFAYGETPYLPSRDFDWTLDGQTYSDGRIAVEKFLLQNPAVTLTFTGDYNVATKQASFNLEFSSEEIKPVSSAFGLDVEGSVRITAKGTANLAEKTVDAELSAAFDHLSGLPDAAAAAVGKSLELTGQVEASGGEPVFFRNFIVTAQNVSARGGGSYSPESGRIEAEANVDLPDLAVFEPAAGQPLTGALAVKLNAEGTAQDFQLTANAAGRNVTFAGAPVRLASAQVKLKGLPKTPQGTVRLVGNWQDQEIVASADVDTEPPLLKVSDITVTAPGIDARGAVTANMETRLLNGTITAVADDLSFAGTATGTRLAGSGRAELLLKAEDGRQDLALRLEASGLATPAAAVERLEARADLSNVFETPSGVAALRAAGIVGDGFRLEFFNAEYEGATDAGTLTAETRGVAREPLELAARAEWRREDGTVTASLAEFGGRWGEYPVQLVQPAVVVMDAQGWRLRQSAVRFGAGELRAEGAYMGGRVEGELAVDELPLEVVQAFGGPGLSGTAEGRVRIDGAAVGPAVDVEARLASLGTLPPAENAPPVDIVMQAAYRPDRVEGTVQILQLFESPVEARFSAPLVFSISPAAFEIPQQEPLRAEVRFEGRLERLTSLVVLEDQQASGDLRGRLELTGTPAQPLLNGAVDVGGGAYENFQTGTVLRDLTARIVAENSVLRIVSATATDGGSGSVVAEGVLSLSSAKGYPVDARVTMEDFRAVQREDVTATVGGNVDLKGRLSELRVSGKLAVAPVHVSLAQWRSSPVESLEVVDVNVPPALYEEMAALHPKPKESNRPALFEDIALDIELNVSRAEVRGYGIESEWKGDLKVGGTAAAPAVTGELNSVRGQLVFAGKTFRLEDSSIALRGETPPNPVLDIAAEHQTRDITAIFRITGTADDPQIALESSPQLPQDEILARVLFGRDLAQVSPVEALRLARAANALATGREGIGLLGRLGRTLGLEGLSLGEVGEEGELGLTFGRYLGKNVYLNVSQGFGTEAARAGIEVEISDHLMLESTFSGGGETGVSLNWKQDY